MKKRALSLLLVVMLLLSLMPAAAFADGTEVGFKAFAGETELTEVSFTPDAYSYYDYNTQTTSTVGVYTVKVPEGTENVKLEFSANVLAYSYKADGTYLSGWYEDYMTGGKEATIEIDCNGDGEIDYVQIQTPYDADWNSTLLYAITFAYEDPTNDPKPNDPNRISPEQAYRASSDMLSADLGTYTYAGQIGGYAVADWYVLALARAGFDIPHTYYASVSAAVKNGEITKVIDYARTVLTLTAAGIDPRSVGGTNLVEGLSEISAFAASNDVIFGLLALDCHNYESKIRNELVDAVLAMQSDNGAWGYSYISGGEWKTPYGTDVDTTAQAITALVPYCADNAGVRAAVDKGLEYLASVQNTDGSFDAYGTKSAESTAQVVIALTALGMDAQAAAEGMCTMALMEGGFTYGGSANSYSTSQGYSALVAFFRSADGKTSLYDMSDTELKAGCPSDKFFDIAADGWYHEALDWCVQNGVVNGMSADSFAPNGTCTRAQTAVMLWRASGCKTADTDSLPFADVSADAYYFDALCWAYENGIVKGMSADSFAPNGICTRAQTAVMLWRALGCKAADTDSLPFADVSPDAYYFDALCWAYENGIVNGMSADSFAPNGSCTRAQTAAVIFRAYK